MSSRRALPERQPKESPTLIARRAQLLGRRQPEGLHPSGSFARSVPRAQMASAAPFLPGFLSRARAPIGRSASAPSAAVPALVFSRRSRWTMSASFSSSSRSSVQFQVRRNRRPSRSTKLLRPMVDRSSATSWTQRKRSYVRQCMPFGLSGNSSDMLALPPSRIRIFRDFPSPR